MEKTNKVLSPKKYRFSDVRSQDLKCPDYIEGDEFCCCIYGIRRKSDGKVLYVGQTNNLHTRIKAHYLGNKNRETEIDGWMREHRGEYEYVILKKFERKEMDYWEEYYIREHNTLKENGGFNQFAPNRTPEREKKSKSDGNKRWYQKKKQDLENAAQINDYSSQWYREHPEANRKKAYTRKYRDFPDFLVLLEKHDWHTPPAKEEANRLGIRYE